MEAMKTREVEAAVGAMMRLLVDHAEAVEVRSLDIEGRLILTVTVAENDMGHVIGARAGKHYELNLVDQNPHRAAVSHG